MEKILLGDSLEVLKSIESESVDLLCTDPPYGYSFMGKSWDKTLPDIGIFKECFRVLKAGSFAFVMSAPRSDVCARMMLLLEEAGFEIGFTPIYWTYASGFPKAMNIGKMVDKREGVEREVVGKSKRHSGNPANSPYHADGITERVPTETRATSDAAKALEGSYGGFQPKPAVEVVIVAMKPLSEKTYVDQALKNGKGITWLDDCRVPCASEADAASATPQGKATGKVGALAGSTQNDAERTEFERPDVSKGRFPANLLVSDDVLNDGVERKSNGNHEIEGYDATPNGVYGKFGKRSSVGHKDTGSYSRYFDLDAWWEKQDGGFCEGHDFIPNCTTCVINKRDGLTKPPSTLPFLIVPKASKSEKNAGLDGMEEKFAPKGNNIGRDLDNPKNHLGGMQGSKAHNHHPTVKPLKLMSYLITLGSREGDTVLDPFLGSGTTAIAAKQLNRNYIGIEREAEYVEIAKARIASVIPTLL